MIATESGTQLFMPIMEKLFGGYNPQGDGDSAKLLGFEVPPPMPAMMGSFTTLRLFTILSGMVKVEITKEDLLSLTPIRINSKNPNKQKTAVMRRQGISHRQGLDESAPAH